MSNSKAPSAAKRVGLAPFFWCFRFYGFSLSDSENEMPGSSRAHPCHVICFLLIGILTFLGSSYELMQTLTQSFFFFEPGKSICRICNSLDNWLHTLYFLVYYLMMRNKLAQYSKMVTNFATKMDAISDEVARQALVSSTRRWVSTCITLAVVNVILCAAVTFIDTKTMMVSKLELSPVKEVIVDLVLSFWMLFCYSFCIIYSYFAVVYCKMLRSYIAVAFSDAAQTIKRKGQNGCHYPLPLTISERQIRHQSVCRLVSEANAVLSDYMLVSVVFECISFATTTKAHDLDDTFNITRMAGTLLIALAIFVFAAKTIICSSINDKILSGLSVPNPDNVSELQYYSGEHVNFLIYMNQQTTNRCAITYGGLYVINKDYIFTIMGFFVTITSQLNSE